MEGTGLDHPTMNMTTPAVVDARNAPAARLFALGRTGRVEAPGASRERRGRPRSEPEARGRVSISGDHGRRGNRR